MKRTLIGLTSAALLAGSLSAAHFGVAIGTAQAEPRPVTTYHWCPGDYFRPEWGDNWDTDRCHDEYHRDGDSRYDNSRPRGIYGPPNIYYTPPGAWPTYGPNYGAPGIYFLPRG